MNHLRHQNYENKPGELECLNNTHKKTEFERLRITFYD